MKYFRFGRLGFFTRDEIKKVEPDFNNKCLTVYHTNGKNVFHCRYKTKTETKRMYEKANKFMESKGD